MTEKERIIDMIGYLLKRLVELDDETEKDPPLIMYDPTAPVVHCPWCQKRAVTLFNTGEKLVAYNLGYCPHCKKKFPISKYPEGDLFHMKSADIMECDTTLWKQTGGKMGRNWEAADE